MTEIQTVPTTADPEEFIATVENERRRSDAQRLLGIMAEVTGEPAVMWGPAIVGFGSHHYRYASGREGDTMKVGFSPRKNALTLYGLQGHPRNGELLERLGPHTVSRVCVYVKKLDDVDEGVLRELISYSFEHADSAV